MQVFLYMKRIQVLLLIVCFLSVVACTKNDGEDNSPYKDMTAKQLYSDSQQALLKKQFDSAAKQLEALESMYPFSNYAEIAQMNLIYAYYQNEDYASAAATAERFIHLYPRAKQVDYAYYMKALANFQQTRGTLANIFPIDESWRDPGTQSQAYSDFATLVQRFPDSRYKADSLQRMIYLRNMFAQRELNTANYYYARKMYVAAAERANFLVKNYPQASCTQQGLALLYYSNKALGLNKAAQDTLTVYRSTYHTQPTEAIFKNS
jgi:outer membrane protein assembly factor BamD